MNDQEWFQAVKRIANQFAPEWTFDNDATWPAMTRKDGARILFYRPRYNSDRCQISGRFPLYQGSDFLPTRAVRPEMSVSVTRDPQRIFAELNRKVIPPYLALYEQASIARKKCESEHNVALRLTSRLARIWGLTPIGGLKQFSGNINNRTGLDAGPYISATVSSDSVDIRLDRLTVEEAIEVMRLIRYRKKKA
jgi:hypothetical protein